MIMHSSVDFVNSIQSYQTNVHQGRDVVLPAEYSQMMSLNGKFILHVKQDTNLLYEAFASVQRSARIKDFFRTKVDSVDYIPRFHVRTSNWEPPPARRHVEAGLSRVQASLFKQAAALSSQSALANPNIGRLLRFLRDERYLVKITDKNLGLAVVTKEWYDDQCRLHLGNAAAYERFDTDIDMLSNEILDTLQNARLRPNILAYLGTSTRSLPRFHVIPKIHKDPWASRPIVPSHSWATSRASEVVDFFLQPTLRKYPWVLQSTRDLLDALRSFDPDTDDELWLVTGDVRAMYTNIPPAAAARTVRRVLMTHGDLRGNSLSGLTDLFGLVMENNLFTYSGMTYRQVGGLAMGTACAPCVANLYMAEFEERLLPMLRTQGLCVYGRYIDDIFMVLRGTREQTIDTIGAIQVPHLDITWETSRKELPFLDVSVSIDNRNRIQTSVYRKALNNYMYIPYSSAHPESVKKAFVKAELSRFRTICSTQEALKQVEGAFRSNLYRRGYPTRLLDRLWHEPSKAKPEGEPVLLPSVYNPVWEYVSTKKLEEAFTALDLSAMPKALTGRWIKTLKRGRNLYDYFARSNMTILDGEAALGS